MKFTTKKYYGHHRMMTIVSTPCDVHRAIKIGSLACRGCEFFKSINVKDSYVVCGCKPELLEACEMALGAFENNNAIDWDILDQAIKKSYGEQKP
jgi:hypothetical protein